MAQSWGYVWSWRPGRLSQGSLGLIQPVLPKTGGRQHLASCAWGGLSLRIKGEKQGMESGRGKNKMKRQSESLDPATFPFWLLFLFPDCVTRGTEQYFTPWGKTLLCSTD